MKPTYDEWRIRGGEGRAETRQERGFTNGPYTVSFSPVHQSKRSPGFDHAVFDGNLVPQWCGTEAECSELADKWNTSYALHLMVRGTAAEKL